MIFFDTNVLVDVGTKNRWSMWAAVTLSEAAEAGGVAVNHVVLSELYASRAGRDRTDDLRAALAFAILPLTDEVAFRAGQAHRLYRDRRGPHRSILADFLIGAHAVVERLPLATRDRRKFASYFPELTIIAPESDQP